MLSRLSFFLIREVAGKWTLLFPFVSSKKLFNCAIVYMSSGGWYEVSEWFSSSGVISPSSMCVLWSFTAPLQSFVDNFQSSCAVQCCDSWLHSRTVHSLVPDVSTLETTQVFCSGKYCSRCYPFYTWWKPDKRDLFHWAGKFSKVDQFLNNNLIFCKREAH